MMFGFFKKIFIELLRGSIIRRFSESLGRNSEKPIKYNSLHNRKCQAEQHLKIETRFSSYTDSFNKYGGSCNSIWWRLHSK